MHCAALKQVVHQQLKRMLHRKLKSLARRAFPSVLPQRRLRTRRASSRRWRARPPPSSSQQALRSASAPPPVHRPSAQSAVGCSLAEVHHQACAGACVSHVRRRRCGRRRRCARTVPVRRVLNASTLDRRMQRPRPRRSTPCAGLPFA
eukprot:3084411-Pleurochrysis_carterae.AAC.1